MIEVNKKFHGGRLSRNLIFPDNIKAIFGTAAGLGEIYDDGTNLVVDPGSGFVDLQGTLGVTGHINVGNNYPATAGDNIALNLDEIFTDPSSASLGLNFNVRIAGTPGSFDHTGLFGTVTSEGTLDAAPTGIWSGVTGRVLSVFSGKTLTEGRGIVSDGAFVGDTVTKYSGMYVKTPLSFAGGAVTEVNGMWIEKQLSTTTQRGLVLVGKGAGSDIVFGDLHQSSIQEHATGGYLELVADLQSLGGRWVQSNGDHRVVGDLFIVDTNGVVVGHTSKIDFGAIPEFQVLGTDVPDSSMGFGRFSNDDSSGDFRFLKSRGATIGANVIVQDGDRLGRIRFQGADGTDFNTTAAEIVCKVDGTTAENDIPGSIIIRTRISGGSLTDKIIINDEGKLGIKIDPLEELHISNAQNSSTFFRIDNTEAGTAAAAGGVYNTATSTGLFFQTSSSYTAIPIATNRFNLVSGAASIGVLDSDGINIVAAKAGADLRLYTGGVASSNEIVRIDSTGLAIKSGVLYIKETTTPTAKPDHGAIYTKANNELFFQDGAGVEHLLHGDAFSNIWFHSVSKDTITISTADTFNIIDSFENVGVEDDLGNAVGSTTNNNIVIGANGGGKYDITFHVSITSNGAASEMVIAVGITLNTPLNITAATNATPIVITSVGHGLFNGDMVTIAGATGNTAVNGDWVVTAKTADNITLIDLSANNSVGNGVYDSGSGDITIDYPGNLPMHRQVSQTELGVGGSSSESKLFTGDEVALYVANIGATRDLELVIVNLEIFRIGD